MTQGKIPDAPVPEYLTDSRGQKLSVAELLRQCNRNRSNIDLLGPRREVHVRSGDERFPQLGPEDAQAIVNMSVGDLVKIYPDRTYTQLACWRHRLQKKWNLSRSK